ncbi:hypothetical protein ACEU6E_02060 [Halorutilales archaeon Cl-col2-1]
MIEATILVFGLKSVVGLVGLFVSLQAYRGYRRHGSRSILFIGVGILFLTTVPVALSYGVAWLTQLPAAYSVVSIAVSYLVGLASVDYALN